MHETQQTRPCVSEAKVGLLLVGLPCKPSVEESRERWHEDNTRLTTTNYHVPKCIMAALIDTIDNVQFSLDYIRRLFKE